MASKKSKPKRQRVYRSVRTGKTVLRRYLGLASDPVVMALTRLDQLTHAEQAAEREMKLEEAAAYANMEPVIRIVACWAKRLAWRFHDRMRKDDGVTRLNETGSKTITIRSSNGTDTMDISHDDFDDLVHRATAGDASALAELRQTLRENPLIYRRLGNLSALVQKSLIDSIAGKSLVAAEALKLKLAEMQDELGRTDRSLLENLLVDQVLNTWLDVAFVQVGLAQSQRKADAQHWEKRLTRAQRRHLDAIKALAALQAAAGADRTLTRGSRVRD